MARQNKALSKNPDKDDFEKTFFRTPAPWHLML